MFRGFVKEMLATNPEAFTGLSNLEVADGGEDFFGRLFVEAAPNLPDDHRFKRLWLLAMEYIFTKKETE